MYSKYLLNLIDCHSFWRRDFTIAIIILSLSFLILLARWNHLYFAAKKYAEDHNGENYFSALTEVRLDLI